MKRIISLLMVITLLVSVCILNVSAASRDMKMGDVNIDYKVDILDATIIQKVLVQLHDNTHKIEYLGDVDHDNKLNILDATYIQMWLAGLIDDNDIDVSYFSPDIYVHDDYADYESGKAMVGVPVTFTVNAESEVQPLKYNLYVDDKLVATSDYREITYTFNEVGTYSIVLKTRSIFSYGNSVGYWEYEVVEPYEYTGPEITTAYITGKHMDTVLFGRDNMKVNVEVKGGVAPYQYKFELTRPETAAYKAEDITITQDFSDKNYFELERINYDDICWRDYAHSGCEIPCGLNITVKDANGVETTKTMEFVYSNNYPI